MRVSKCYTNIVYNCQNEEHTENNRQFQAMATIAITKGGRIFTSWETGGFTEPHPDQFIVVKYSDDDGKTWSDDLFHIETKIVDDKLIFVADSCLWVDPEGKLHLYWTQEDVNKDDEFFEVQHFKPSKLENCYSDCSIQGWIWGDDTVGCTWEMVCDDPDAEEIVFGEPHYAFDYGMINKPLVTKSGRWIFSKYRLDLKVHFAYSDDKGKTYTEIEPICDKTYQDVEPCLFEKEDGTLVCIWRAPQYLRVNYSYDNGETWTPIENTDIETCFSKACVLKLPDGRVFLVNNDDQKDRIRLSFYVSEDEGKTWEKCWLDPRWHVQYPDIDYHNGFVYVVYDRERFRKRQIMFAKINVSEIPHPKSIVELKPISSPQAPLGKNFMPLMEVYGLNKLFEFDR